MGVCPFGLHVFCGLGESFCLCPPGSPVEGTTGERFQWVLGPAGVVPCHHLFVIYMDRISRHTQGEESVQFGDFRIACLLFACCSDPENGWRCVPDGFCGVCQTT